MSENSMDAGARPVGAAGESVRHKAVVAAGIGNAVEWYDFALYGALAPAIGATFFATGSQTGDLVAAFAVFAIAFVVRPVGAVLVGPLGDRFGRRWLLSSTVLIMSLATAAIGALPGQDVLGVAAPVLLVAFRMLQGLSAGGEVGGGIAYLVEYAPATRRGLYGAWYVATLALGLAAGVGVAAVASAPAFGAWGWRLPFLLALPAGLVGLYLRLRLVETPAFRNVARATTVWVPISRILRGHGPGVLRGLGMAVALSIGLNTYFIFLPAQLIATGQRPATEALAVALAGLVAAAATALAAGWASDRLGRRPLTVAGALALVAGAIPILALARLDGSLPLLTGFVAAGVALGCFALPAWLSELFPTPVRATALSLTAGLAAAFFGGTAPLVNTLLSDRLHGTLGPGGYVAAAAVVALLAVAWTPETAFDPLP